MDSWILQFSSTQVALLLFTEYVDLGKWVAAIVGGSHLGHGLSLLLFFNCTAGLWQYLSSCICLVTGKNLAQVPFLLFCPFVTSKLHTPISFKLNVYFYYLFNDICFFLLLEIGGKKEFCLIVYAIEDLWTLFWQFIDIL